MILHTPHFLPHLPRFAAASARERARQRATRGSTLARRFSTKALAARLSRPALAATAALAATLRAGRRTGRWLTTVVRDCGIAQHWRFLVLLALLSFATAWLGTRAVMAGFESSWSAAALAAARHENQELRIRQDLLREQTEEALTRLAAAETHLVRTP